MGLMVIADGGAGGPAIPLGFLVFDECRRAEGARRRLPYGFQVMVMRLMPMLDVTWICSDQSTARMSDRAASSR